MELNTENLDELMRKLTEVKAVLNSLDEIVGKCEYLTVKDVAKILNISEASARAYMNRPDFPLLKVGKTLKVNSWAFLLYNMEARK